MEKIMKLCSIEVKGNVNKDLNLHKIAYRADLNSFTTYVPLFNLDFIRLISFI